MSNISYSFVYEGKIYDTDKADYLWSSQRKWYDSGYGREHDYRRHLYRTKKGRLFEVVETWRYKLVWLLRREPSSIPTYSGVTVDERTAIRRLTEEGYSAEEALNILHIEIEEG